MLPNGVIENPALSRLFSTSPHFSNTSIEKKGVKSCFAFPYDSMISVSIIAKFILIMLLYRIIRRCNSINNIISYLRYYDHTMIKSFGVIVDDRYSIYTHQAESSSLRDKSLPQNHTTANNLCLIYSRIRYANLLQESNNAIDQCMSSHSSILFLYSALACPKTASGIANA